MRNELQSVVHAIYRRPPDRGKVASEKGEARPAPTGQASVRTSSANRWNSMKTPAATNREDISHVE